MNDRNTAADITQARFPLSASDAAQLANRLGLEPSDLTRPLSPEESSAWRFYRLSATNTPRLWAHIEQLIAHHEISVSEAARVMGMPPSHLSNAFAGREEGRVLTYETARQLAERLKLDGGPESIIAAIIDDKDTPGREP